VEDCLKKNIHLKFFNGPCTQQTWAIPEEFQFNYDTSNMTCPVGLPRNSALNWTLNRPLCPSCNTYARPNVYNFGDYCFIENTAQENNKSNWIQAAEKILKRDNTSSVVMLEIGVGQRLPKIRVTFERMQENFPLSRCTIIRINPEVKIESIQEGLISIPLSGMEALTRINKHF